MKFRATYLLLILVAFSIVVSHQSIRAENEDRLTFMGKIIRVAPGPMMASGDLAVFRLAKYRVLKVCSGSYSGEEIVVDHLMKTGQELETAKPGDVLRVDVYKYRNNLMRPSSYPGIREPSEKPDFLYIGIDSHTATETNCAASDKK